MAQQFIGVGIKALAKAAMKKKAKSSMTKKAAVAAGASNEYIGSLPKSPGPGQFMSKEKYKAAMKDYKKAPARKKAAEKREKAALKSINRKPVPKRSRSGKASGR
jgi:hypothetical protein